MRPRAITSIAVLTTLALTGCGTSTPAATKKIPVIDFKSPAVGPQIPARYTCDGHDISPPIEWGPVPADTGNLVLLILGFKQKGNTTAYQVTVEWALAGINPELRKIAAGEVPPGAFVGLDTDHKHHYHICPPKGKTAQYRFELYGLPAGTKVSPYFAGLPVLSSLEANPTPATAHGTFVATYKRQ